MKDVRLALQIVLGGGLLTYIVSGGPVHYARLWKNVQEEHRDRLCGKAWLVGSYFMLSVPLLMVAGFLWLIVTG